MDTSASGKRNVDAGGEVITVIPDGIALCLGASVAFKVEMTGLQLVISGTFKRINLIMKEMIGRTVARIRRIWT